MIDGRWRRVRDLFEAAADLSGAERDSFLQAETGGDADLLREVMDLLDADDKSDRFLEGGPINPAELVGELAGHWVGRRFGPYEAVREVGRGGVGVVLLGERADGRYTGQVAIKVVHTALMRGDLVERFRTEGQILADLDHPNIARLLDAGDTEDSLSYLIMEYVDGPRIDVFADDALLDVPGRLRLFRSVLEGVDYAHARGVIHRDLKPSNILVTADGRPKLVDFGIAKLFAPAGPDSATVALTQTRMMTPEYASPEQIRGLPVGAASDVYSLGVVLYRLLTGHPPYALSTTRPSAAEKIICEESPRRPSNALTKSVSTTGVEPTVPILDPAVLARNRSSTLDRLQRALRGDLDTIILKALSKDPTDRYATAGALGDDIDRHLAGSPIRASSPGPVRRLRRFVGRKRVPLAVAAVVIAGLAAAGWQASVAGEARTRAQQNSAELTRLAESTLANLERMRALDGGSTAVIEMGVTSTVASLDELVQRIEGPPDPALLMTLGRAYAVAGMVQGNPNTPNLGKIDEAQASYAAAVELFERVFATSPTTEFVEAELARSRISLGDILTSLGRTEEARELFEAAKPVIDSLAVENPDDVQFVLWSALAFERLGNAQTIEMNFEGAEVSHERGSELLEGIDYSVLDPPTQLRLRLNRVASRTQRADVLATLGRLDEAVGLAREAVRLSDSIVAANPEQVAAVSYQHGSYFTLGWQLLRSDQFAEAEVAFATQFEVLDRFEGLDPSNAQVALRRGMGHEGRGQNRIKASDWSGALADEKTALDILLPLAEQNPGLTFYVAQIQRQIGEALTGLGRLDEAEEPLARGVELVLQARNNSPDQLLLLAAISIAYSSSETLYLSRGDCASALAHRAAAISYADSSQAVNAWPPEFENIWEDFEARKPAGACGR